MPIDSAWNAYIFRDGKTTTSGPRLVEELADELAAYSASPSQTLLTDLLLRAGELECALRDLDSPYAALAERITDIIATAFGAAATLRADELARQVRGIAAPQEVHVAPPEGFAYYALHPLDFADLVRSVRHKSATVAILGIRSIGTTISAIVKAAVSADGRDAERITVRPSGHPYDRRTTFSAQQKQWIDSMLTRSAEFFVVDEGPGMSGSSFLSVGEALVESGVPRAQIAFLGSRVPDPASLTAPNAAERWTSFSAHYTQSTRHLPPGAKHYVAGGIWRAKVFDSEDEWPASWRQMERLKFLSDDGSRLYRFEGFGRFGEAVHQRALKVAQGGFGPMPLSREQGFGVYPMIAGRHLTANNATPRMLERLADYCAYRAQELTASVTHTPELESMLRFNSQEEFGVELPAHLNSLRIERPVIADGRMLPYKWISTAGTALKVDAATHGDDHFFPGPTDIAWDLAGVIVEWELGADASAFFLDHYQRASGDDPRKRLPAYFMAYAIFRTAYCKMAAVASNGTPECDRFLRDLGRYRRQAKSLLATGSLHATHKPQRAETHAA